MDRRVWRGFDVSRLTDAVNHEPVRAPIRHSPVARCKFVVATRLKRGGSCRFLNGANAIITLRCAILSNRFADFRERRAIPYLTILSCTRSAVHRQCSATRPYNSLPQGPSPQNRRSTLSTMREMLLLKSLCGRLPQNVIDPTENTAPPLGVSKYTISERRRSRTRWGRRR